MRVRISTYWSAVDQYWFPVACVTAALAGLGNCSCKNAPSAIEERREIAKRAEEAEKAAEARALELKKKRREESLEVLRAHAKLTLQEERGRLLAQGWNRVQENRAAEALEIANALLGPELLRKTIDVPALEPNAPAEEEQVAIELSAQEAAQVYDLKATALFKLDEVAEAIATYEEVLKLDSDSRQARRILGMLYFGESRWADALAAWEGEMAYRDPKVMLLVGEAHYRLSKESGDRGRLEGARIAIESVLVQDPNDEKVRQWLATIEIEAGRLELALRHLDAILEQNPLAERWLELKGQALLQLGRHEEAVETYELLYSAHPKPAVCQALSDLYALLDQPGIAADWLARAYARLNPRAVPASDRLRIGRLLAEAERAEEAVEWLSIVDEQDAEFAAAQASLARLYRAVGRLDDALEAFERIRRAKPDDCAAHLAAGDVFLERKQLDEARDAYTIAASFNDCKPDGLAGLAEVAYAGRNLPQALELYRDALGERPRDPAFESAIREIEAELSREQLSASRTAR
jgi:tetratricopeptide (TPR) repeat protein